jgi:hypothetical protein
MAYANSSEANILRWTPEQRDCYEIYYLTLNHLASRTGFWIRYTLHAPVEGRGEPYVELWFSYFDLEDPDRGFGLARQYPIDALAHAADPFRVAIGDGELTNQSCSGVLEGGGHSARWELRFEPCAMPFLHFPENLYTSGEVESAMLSPHFSTTFSGSVEVDGRRLSFAGDPGEQSHTWGRRHPPHWLWAHCNAFAEDPDAAMELVVALPEQGHPASFEAHVLYAKVGGREHRLLSLLDGSKSSSVAQPGHWKLFAEGDTLRIEVEIECRPINLIEAHYVDPDGASAYCINTEVASSTLSVSTRTGESDAWTVVGTLSSDGTTHAEWGDYEPHPEVLRKVLVIP